MACGLVLIDGIFGSGKSTTAKAVFAYLQARRIACAVYEEEAEAAIREIWETRGDGFKSYCVRVDAATPYAIAGNLKGEAATIRLWAGFQKTSDALYKGHHYISLHFLIFYFNSVHELKLFEQ